jgi:hypothetical protein
MSYRRNKYNKYNREKMDNNTPSYTLYKLYLNNNLKKVLRNINDPISKRLLKDSDKSTNKFTTNWINMTNSSYHLSYSIPSKVKTLDSAWDKSNRVSIQIKKLIKRIYKRSFNNKEIKRFVSLYKNEYNRYTKKIDSKRDPDDKKTYKNSIILNNILLFTEKTLIKWTFPKQYSENYIIYEGTFNISKQKKIIIRIYYSDSYNNYITFEYQNVKSASDRSFIKIINDNDGVDIIKLSIDDILNFD